MSVEDLMRTKESIEDLIADFEQAFAAAKR